MLKSTKAKLFIEQERNQIFREQIENDNNLKTKELELREEELKTKNRVEISLKEYEELKKENEQLKIDLSNQRETLLKIFKSFKKEDVDVTILDKLFNGEFECRVISRYNPIPNKQELCIIYELSKEK